MKKISRRNFMKATSVVLAASALAGCGASSTAAGSTAGSTAAGSTAAAGNAKYELKISTTQGETAKIYEGMQNFADKVNQDTNGDVKITIYPSSQLGAEEDMIDQALQGMNIAVLTDAGRMSNYTHDIGIFNMAYLVDNYDEACKVMDTDTFKGWEDDLAGQGLQVLCFNFYDGARSFMTNKACKTPADLKGMVIRTPGADPYVKSIEAMGATAYNVAWSEVYNSIQTKVIDGCEVQYTSAVSTHIYEVCKYIDKTEHIQLVNALVGGTKWFESLPADYQEIVLKDAYDCAYDNAKEIESMQADLEKTLTDNGMEIVDVDLDAFKSAVDGAYDELGWAELRQQLYTAIGK